MESRAKAGGHAIHQQLVAFPLGLLTMAVLFDIIGLLAHDGRFSTAAFLMVAAGVVTGLLAAVFGAIDYFAIPHGTRARRIGALHGSGNVIMVVLFAISWLLRRNEPDYTPTTMAFILALVAVLISFGTGWLGGELVGRLGVGIDDNAGLDAPADFTTRISLSGGRGQAAGRKHLPRPPRNA
jgi:uncharacterized membrane protein